MARAPSVEDLIAAVPQPCLVVDNDQRIIALNKGGETLFGAQLVDRPIVTALRNPQLLAAVESCLRSSKDADVTYTSRQNAQDVTYAVHLAPLGVGYLLLSFQDLTDVHNAEQMRRDFVANVSHELRTPLTSLMGFIETLRGPARDDAGARDRFLHTMEDEAARMNRLIDGLLSLSRVEAEERVRPTDRVDMKHVLQTTLRNLNPLAIAHGVSFNVDLAQAPLEVAGDKDQLVQVLTNLIENAIKYGGDELTVDITAEIGPHDPALRGPAIRVAVCDYGPGIKGDHIPRLTERFYRGDTHRARILGGTGLGLAIVKHILNRHQGRLKVTSVLGEGATFTLVLPMLAPPDST